MWRRWLFVVLVPLACDRGGAPRAVKAELDDASVETPRTEALPVEGWLDAVVSVPPRGGALVVAAHGAWDAPEPHCAMWQRIVGARAFVVCPRGREANPGSPPGERAYFFHDENELGREVAACVAALEARFGARVDVHRAVYAGFSQGAIQAAVMLRTNRVGFARAVLVEGGVGEYQEWGPAAAKGYRAGGGERVLFACGRAHCLAAAEASARVLAAEGVEARAIEADDVGHSYGGEMEAALHRAMGWVVEGDLRFTPSTGDP